MIFDWRAGSQIVLAPGDGRPHTLLGEWSIRYGETVEAMRLGPGGSVEYRTFDIEERSEAEAWIHGHAEPSAC